MDYVDIVKKAAVATWRHKILWLFGFFAGTWTGYQGLTYQFGTRDIQNLRLEQWQISPEALTGDLAVLRDWIVQWVETGVWVWILLAVAGVIVVVGLIKLVVSIAAQGGLVYLSREALAERETRGMRGWSVGFQNWFRVFGIGFLLALPVAAAVLLLLLGGVFVLVAVLDAESTGAAQVWGAVAFTGMVMLLLGLFAAVAGVVLGIVREIAWRHAILSEMRVWAAIVAAWHALWARQGLVAMWAVQLLVSIMYGAALGIVVLVVLFVALVPLGLGVAVGISSGGAWAVPWILVALVVLFLLFLPLLLAGAIFSAFRGAAWTEFYGRMLARAEAARLATPAPSVEPAPAATPPQAPA